MPSWQEKIRNEEMKQTDEVIDSESGAVSLLFVP